MLNGSLSCGVTPTESVRVRAIAFSLSRAGDRATSEGIPSGGAVMALRPQPLRLNWNAIASLLPVVAVPFLLAGYAPQSNFASSREGNCIGDSWIDFRPLVAVEPPFVAAPDPRHDLGVVCQS